MCSVSLEFPVLKVRQGSILIAHKGAIFLKGAKDAGQPHSIPGGNWSI